MSETPLLRIDDLAVSFSNGAGPRIRAVDGAHLAVYPRQTVAVVGESGCGKSVTALSVLGLIPSPPSRVDRGRIVFQSSRGEVDLVGLRGGAMRSIRGGEIAMIFQEPMTSLNPVLTIGAQIAEAVALHKGLTGRAGLAAAAEAMGRVGIRDPERRLRSYPHEFSGGMRQRAMIAMALACGPALLLADEPTTALDVTIQRQILDLIAGLRDSDEMSAVLITHDLGVVAEYADVVCVMYAGRVVEYASAREVFGTPRHPYTRALLACIPTLDRAQPTGEALVTVARLTGDPAEWTRLGEQLGDRRIRPWWPAHTSPPGSSYGLAELTPGHWVGLWMDGELRGLGLERPVEVTTRRPRPAPGHTAALETARCDP